MITGNAVYENINLEELGNSIDNAENAVLALLSENDRVADMLEEIEALESRTDRLEESGILWVECESFIARCKKLMSTVERASERVKEVQGKLDSKLKDELHECPEGKCETPRWKFALRKNAPSVVILDESEIPKKYMVTPKAPPPRPNKNLIKSQLTSKAVLSIKGVKLDRKERVEVKER